MWEGGGGCGEEDVGWWKKMCIGGGGCGENVEIGRAHV